MSLVAYGPHLNQLMVCHHRTRLSMPTTHPIETDRKDRANPRARGSIYIASEEGAVLIPEALIGREVNQRGDVESLGVT